MAVPTPITYSQLTQKVINESQNISSELANELPEIIRDAERMCNRADLPLINNVIYDSNFYLAGSVVNSITLLTGQTAYLYLPPDCLEVRDLEIYLPASGIPSTNGIDQYTGTAVSPQRISEDVISGVFWPNKSLTQAPTTGSCFYSVLGAQPIYGSTTNINPNNGVLYIAPTPDQNYAYRLHYVTLQTSLVDLGANGVNFLSTWAPDLLFYACMIRYAEFAKATEQLQYWTMQFQSELKSEQLEEVRRKSDSYKDSNTSAAPIVTRSS